MTAQDTPTKLPPTSASQYMLPVFPLLPSNRHGKPITYAMPSEPISSALCQPALPAAAMSSLSLQDDGQATPTPKQRKALSESSLSTIALPDSTRGTPLIVDGSQKHSSNATDQIFVQVQDEDDVFGRSSSTTPTQKARPLSPPSIATAKGQPDVVPAIPFIKNPRPDRLKSPITPANAQGILPPTAVVFAANLSVQRQQYELEIECQKIFGEFGQCHVKVKQDKRRHPFAIIQYHRAEDAELAVESSTRYPIVMDGRVIRCERGEARRAIVLLRVDGRALTLEEATEALKGLGSIETMHLTTHKDALDFGLPPGVFVQFAYWQDYHDVVRQFENNVNSRYRIHVPRRLESQTHAGSGGSPIYKTLRIPRSATDQKSVFVGNLPTQTDEQDLKNIFDSCGVIKAINIIHKQLQGGAGFNIFGFVEFSSSTEAEAAACMEAEIHGCKIRIEPKEYSARRELRLRHRQQAMSPFAQSQAVSPYDYNQALDPYTHDRAAPPLTHDGHASNFQQICGHNLPLGYNSGYFHTPNPAYQTGDGGFCQSFHSLPLYPPYQGGFSGMTNYYETPPPSSRLARHNEVAYPGSPHGVALWSPFVANSGYAAQLMQIPEDVESEQY